MGLSELVIRIALYVVVIPFLGAFGAIFSAAIMFVGVLLAPVACIVSLFTKNPYDFVTSFYENVLYVAVQPVLLLEKLVKM